MEINKAIQHLAVLCDEANDGPWFCMPDGFAKHKQTPTVYAPGDELRYIAFFHDLPSFGKPTKNLANARFCAHARVGVPMLLESLLITTTALESIAGRNEAYPIDYAKQILCCVNKILAEYVDFVDHEKRL